MVARLLIIASVACFVNLANAIEPFPGFKKCKSSDSDCILENAIKGVSSFGDGIPELGVRRLDPDFFDKVDASSPNLKFILSDITLTGLKSCKPTKVTRDAAKSQIFLILQCALKLDGNYELDGNVLILKIKGKGKIHVYLRNIVNTVTLDYVIKEGKDGQKHLRIKKFDHTYKLNEKSDVVFEGLFQDNDVLSQAADDLIKNNGNEIVEEIGGGMFTAAVTRIVENFNKFFGKLPYEDISID
uniref:Odorant binding protein n=1 Tax=Athetis dissimilis TaxID=1737331 RepID=A0A4D6Q9A2_ATHDI|nr:odorant binding protein [Athetis dissimilis]